MRETLYNQRFGDIYFSPEDGLAETEHVFLAGNGLPARWQDRHHFTIAETGFGTGLNFLAAWALFEETALKDQTLDFISIELYPLSVCEIRSALAGWADRFSGRLDRLLACYPLRVPGFHRLQLTPRVRLTLIFDDVNEALPQVTVPGGVDAWFLDGFAPAKNPGMWSDTLYREMDRLSAPGASAATFTVAGHVRRGLESAGFAVEKTPGFGRKKQMTTAWRQQTERQATKRNEPQRIAIVGGGLAGTSCAHVLGQQNVKATIFEKASKLAAGASGNSTGLYNPRFSAQRTPESAFYVSAYAQAVRTFHGMDEDIGFHPCGALHLVHSPEKEKKFKALCENWAWHSDHLQYLSAAQASAQAGIPLQQNALFLPDAGCVAPRGLCHAYAGNVDIRLNTPVTSLERGAVNGEEFDAVIVACAAAARQFDVLSWLPLHTVRGQISMVEATTATARLRTNVCFGGYVSPAFDGAHAAGATFQRWLEDDLVKEEDHRENLGKLAEAVPAFSPTTKVSGGWTALRTASKDHFPVIGVATDAQGQIIPGLYVSLAHGSHGIISSLAGAYLLADMILEKAYSLPIPTVSALSAARFGERARRRQAR